MNRREKTPFLSKQVICQALQVPLYQNLYHLFRALRAWPVGVWRSVSGRTSWERKTGGMLVVTLQHGGVFVAYANTHEGHVSKQPLWVARIAPETNGDGRRVVLRLVEDAQHPNAMHTVGIVSCRVGEALPALHNRYDWRIRG